QRARNGIALFPELQRAEILLQAVVRDAPRDAVEAGLIYQNRADGLELVEVDLLRHEADAGFRDRQLAVDVMAEHLDLAAALVDQRGDDADCSGLAGAVRPQQREEIALFDRQVDALERLDAVLIGLGELVK